MKIDSEKIKKIKEFYAEIKKGEEEIQKMVEEARGKSGENNHKKKLKDKEIDVKENQMWDELLAGTPQDTFSTNILKEKYPKVFELQDQINKTIKNLDGYLQSELGISYNGVTVGDIIDLVEAVVDQKINEKKQ